MKVIPSNVTEFFITVNLDDEPIFAWWSNAAKQPNELFDELSKELVNITTREEDTYVEIWGEDVKNLTFGYASAAKAAELMYKGTKIDGVWEKVPEKLRGVFWMKGNGVSEELTVMQYGTYFEDEHILLVPMAPFMWGWAGGTPKNAPYGGRLYSVTEVAALVLTGDGKPGITYSYTFASDNLTIASLQAHQGGDLREDSVDFKTLVPVLPDVFHHLTGKFTMEEMPDSPPGSSWKRTNRWGVGACSCVEFGSYDLVKIIDKDGSPLEPAYSEFIDYMGDVPIFVWSGFTSEPETPPKEEM